MTPPAQPHHLVALVRPGPCSLDWLQRTVRELKGIDPLRPVRVVAASPYMATVVRHKLAETGCANVSFTVQLRPIAERIARACGSTAFDQPLTGPLEAAAIRVAVRDSGGAPLRSLADNRALQEALGSLFRELGHLDDVDAALAALAQGGSVGAAARRTYAAYLGLTREFPDVPCQLRIAAQLARQAPARAPWAEDLGAVVLYLPPRLDAAEREFLAALGHRLPLAIGVPWLDDELADAPAVQASAALAAALNVPLTSVEHVQAPPTMRVLSAPDPEEEARTVVRRVLADMQDGVPLWRMAVLYTSEDPYAPVVRETLDSAGVPWHSALGRPASAGLAARSLLGLLGLRERAFSREAVLDWLAPRPTAFIEEDPLADVPISAWDRLSRRAQVLQGAPQWISRFERLIQTLEREEQERQDWRAEARGHESDEEVPRPGDDLEHARAILGAVRRLDRDTRPPTEPATWDALVDWASGLRSWYVKDDGAWPEWERMASQALNAALESLREGGTLEPTTSLAAFRNALASVLEARRLEEGRAGTGVLVGPLGSSSGADFERAYVLGMAEGWLPSRPPVDPLTSGSTDNADPLLRRERQRSNERRAFAGALASVGERGSITLGYSRTDGAARASYPSRWLLEQVARIEGVPAVYESDLSRLFGAERPWLERVASASDGLQRSSVAMHVADLRLREVVSAYANGQDVSHIALANRPDLVLGRAVRAARARRSRDFTEFDGNLAVIAMHSSRIARPFAWDSGASSATSLERWANCPFQYFLVKVLRVEATDRPEEEWTISALDKGTLVHAALEEFFGERLAQGRSTPHEPFTSGDHARLEQIASALLVDLEAQGRSGHPIAWENARAALLRDLHLELEREEVWRIEEGLAPTLFERTFGDDRDPDTWPAVEVPLSDGTIVRFRGAIDRVDISPSRVLVVDYKSGGTWGYDGLEVDPVLAGRHLQLVLYARAVRANVSEDATEVRAEFRFVSSKGRFERRQIAADAHADERLAEVVQHAAKGIRAGVFLPRPGELDRATFKNCRFCEYERICSASRDLHWQRKSPNVELLPLEPVQ